jgi:formylglycine-generating enzyme required for sulfatase activity
LKGLPGWEDASAGDVTGREVVEGLTAVEGAGGEPVVRAVRGMAVELLHGEAVAREEAKAVREPRPGEERVHPVDGSVLVYVPGGEYTLGSEGISEEEKPVHRVRLSPFWIGKYPVTNEGYGRYLAANPQAPKPAHWEDSQFNQPQQPVVGVSWHEAQAYCRWAGLALPTEAQWEEAARGRDGRLYPWGNEKPTPARANFDGREGRTSPVDAHPAGAGPFGTLDQAGNVWEWCADGWDAKAYEGREGKLDPKVEPHSGDAVVVARRGGSWAAQARALAAAIRSRDWAWYRYQGSGFRCVLARPSEHL